MWMYLFSNDSYGILNSFLINWGFIHAPIQWLNDPDYNFYVVIVVVLWMGMGTGFLSFIAGFKQLNRELFEAAAIDGLRNRWQELWYITLPQMRPQLLIGAVLSISRIFCHRCPARCPDWHAQHGLFHPHAWCCISRITATPRLEMGYASAVAVVLFVIMVVSWVVINKAISSVAPDEG
ncbi:MAG: carbohydrate ABC transporter permease [Oscillospiraceae bacterium]